MPQIYNQEHRIFQDSVRRYLAASMQPYVTAWEEAKWYPSEIYEGLGDQGFLGILIDEKWGGVGGDYVLASAWCEEFGRLPAVGLTVGVNMHSLVVLPALQKFGSTESKEKWLAAGVSGTAIGAYAFTEPGAGSDLTQIQTKARLDGDDYVINGTKIFITNGARAQFVMVLAKTDADLGYDGFTTFVVDTSLPGFSVSRALSKLGWHSSDTVELVMENVRVPKSAVLGEVGKGWVQAMQSLEWERLMLTLTSLGGARACLEDTVRYVNDRKVFGATVASFGHSREKIARMWSQLVTGESLTYYAVSQLQEGKRCRKEVSFAKLFVCEHAIRVADECLQLHGGYGYTSEFLPERWLRDLRLNTIGGGTSQIMARIAARECGL